MPTHRNNRRKKHSLPAAVGSGAAALIIVAGAVWSAWRPRRSGVHLVIGNLLIAVATLILSASGTLAGRLGKDRAFAVTLLTGICVLFAGFLVATGRPELIQTQRLDQAASQELAADVAR